LLLQVLKMIVTMCKIESTPSFLELAKAFFFVRLWIITVKDLMNYMNKSVGVKCSSMVCGQKDFVVSYLLFSIF
jgi:prephenate dehydratase